MKWSPWIHVVETETVPKTKINGGMYMALEGAEAGKEPIGQRIIEVPEKTEDTELMRNPHSGFIAYVPQGAIKKGQALGRCVVEQDHAVRRLPRPRPGRTRSRSRTRRSIAELRCSPAVRHATGIP